MANSRDRSANYEQGSLTIFFDLSRIASLGAIFYIIMDIAIHWGVLRYLRKEIEASAIILVVAIVLDVIVLGALLWVKAQSDMLVIWASVVGLIVIFVGERLFIRANHTAAESETS